VPVNIAVATSDAISSFTFKKISSDERAAGPR